MLKTRRAGEFDRLVQEFTDDTASRPTTASTFGHGDMVPEFGSRPAFPWSQQINDLVTTQFGYHIVKLNREIIAHMRRRWRRRAPPSSLTCEQQARLMVPPVRRGVEKDVTANSGRGRKALAAAEATNSTPAQRRREQTSRQMTAGREAKFQTVNDYHSAGARRLRRFSVRSGAAASEGFHAFRRRILKRHEWRARIAGSAAPCAGADTRLAVQGGPFRPLNSSWKSFFRDSSGP